MPCGITANGLMATAKTPVSVQGVLIISAGALLLCQVVTQYDSDCPSFVSGLAYTALLAV